MKKSFKNRSVFPSIYSLLFCALAMGFLSSCMGPKKLNKWVAYEYSPSDIEPTRKKSELIAIKTTLPAPAPQISTAVQNDSHILPLLFYYHMEEKTTCTLNSQIPLNNFTNTVLTYQGNALKQKLVNQHLELTVESIPKIFAFDNKENMIWVIYVFDWDYVSIQPDSSALQVSYRVLNTDKSVAKNGTITIQNMDRGINLKQFKSARKQTDEYLDQYNAAITNMSRKFVDKLLLAL